jgi:hypothetical protein
VGLLDRISSRGVDTTAPASRAEPPCATKALRKFVACLAARPSPVLLDLGPVVGSNVNFFGEQLGCKIFVEDIFADLDRHHRAGKLADFPAFLQKRFLQTPGTVDGILCWDLQDYLDRASALALAEQLTRLLRPDGALLGVFATAKSDERRFTKYVIVDDMTLRYRAYASGVGRQAVLQNRDIIRLFSALRVTESFLLQNNIREILFRKPPAPA